jgi:hypothetical protein
MVEKIKEEKCVCCDSQIKKIDNSVNNFSLVHELSNLSFTKLFSMLLTFLVVLTTVSAVLLVFQNHFNHKETVYTQCTDSCVAAQKNDNFMQTVTLPGGLNINNSKQNVCLASCNDMYLKLRSD